MSIPSPKTGSALNLQTGGEIIERIPLANAAEAVNDLDQFLDRLLADAPDPQTYFQLLEQVWLPITFVAEELAKRYVNKPIPFGDVEETFFHQVILLWLKTSKAYAQCAATTSPGYNPSQKEHFATLLYRCIYFNGMAILEHHRARREVPWGLWLDLHAHYRSAEDLHLATLPIANLEDTGKTHCAAVYLSFVLCDMAGSYSLSLRDQQLVRRWAIDWSEMIGLHPVVVGETLPPFVIDLMQDVALRPVADCLNTDQIRVLDTSRLSAHIEHIRQELRQRIPLAQIGLSEDCTRQQCLRILGLLTYQWSLARAPRKFRRHATTGTIRICTGFEEMYHFIAGKEFQQPENKNVYSHRDTDGVFSTRFQDDPQQTRETAPSPYGMDDWEIVDQSANGFRLIRSVGGRKMAHGQLLALRPSDSARFLFAQTTWLMQEGDGGLIAGLRALPGLPQAVCARSGVMAGESRDMYQRAFLLPALTTTNAEQSLVLPPGWFRPGIIIEVYSDKAWRARLKKLLDSGPDFERANFEVC
ncbi:MAG: type II toxin-antitoxin system PemK/MazF family toxin [Candidatus Accumulibacter sp.]|jgi:hypothetical protein|nr:type II toxin-antitoxin system PemK/MazF family toxin [Accumulibacter sp.]